MKNIKTARQLPKNLCKAGFVKKGSGFEKEHVIDAKSLDDIDISVHCDIGIFDWLMRFIHHKDPIIEIKNSVSILISSDFLQMKDLVEEALIYVGKNLNEII